MPGYRTAILELKRGEKLKAFTSARVKSALIELTEDANLYTATRIAQVIEAFYVQGKKDGARQAFEQLDAKVAEAKRLVAHRRPGRPRSRRMTRKR
jgi:hypothetical protein